MIVVMIDGKPVEVDGRLASIIRWLVEQRDAIAHGHKTVAVECHGRVIKPTITEHHDPRS